MKSTRYPKLEKLWIEGDPKNPDNFYKGLDGGRLGSICKGIFDDQERLLSELDPISYDAFIERCKTYVSKKDRNEDRGWSQLISMFNEARVYLILKRDELKSIKFIEEVGNKVPDLSAIDNGKSVLVEVKTIWKSDEDIKRDRAWKAKEGLTEPFKKKIKKVYGEALEKFREYPKEADMKYCYMFIHLDLQLSMVKENHDHLDHYLTSIEEDQVEIKALLYP